MFVTLVRKTLEIYLREQRIITQSEFPSESLEWANIKESIFVTLYFEGRVIASSGRIQCVKENSIFECIDNTLLCLKDSRFAPALQTPDALSKISIRVDRFGPQNRRVIQSLDTLDIRKEWLMLLAQNYSALSVILPNMVHVGSTPQAYFDLVFKKAWLNSLELKSEEYVLYALSTQAENDFQ